MKVHKLKLDSNYYDNSAAGIKNFEIRKNDRNYQVGDVLELREWVTWNPPCSGSSFGRRAREAGITN